MINNLKDGEYGYSIEEALKVIHFIADKKATFNKEIIAQTGLRKKRVRNIKVDLLEKDVLENLRPKITNPDQRILKRRTDLMNRGITGKDQWAKRSWVGLNSDLEWELVSSITDQKGIITGWNTLDEYHNIRSYHDKESYDKPINLVEDKTLTEFIKEKYDE